MKIFQRAKMLGIGLLELMLSLAIIALLLIMATRYFQTTSNTQSVNQAVDMVSVLPGAVRNFMNSNLGASQIPAISTLVSGGYLPQSYSDYSTANPWGGAICMGSSSATSCKSGDEAFSIASTYRIVMDDVPSTLCTQVQNRINATLTAASAACGDASGSTTSLTVTVNY